MTRQTWFIVFSGGILILSTYAFRTAGHPWPLDPSLPVSGMLFPALGLGSTIGMGVWCATFRPAEKNLSRFGWVLVALGTGAILWGLFGPIT